MDGFRTSVATSGQPSSVKAVAALPPLRYTKPDPDTEPACQPREDLPREDLLAQPLLHNPILDTRPAQSRATPAGEKEMLRWASHGVTRVRHVLHDTGKRVLTFPELAARHPALVGTGQVRNRVRRMHEAIRGNLDKWKKVIAAPPCTHVRAGQFRHDAEGRLLRATETGTPARPTVRARVCQLEAHSPGSSESPRKRPPSRLQPPAQTCGRRSRSSAPTARATTTECNRRAVCCRRGRNVRTRLRHASCRRGS